MLSQDKIVKDILSIRLFYSYKICKQHTEYRLPSNKALIIVA